MNLRRLMMLVYLLGMRIQCFTVNQGTEALRLTQSQGSIRVMHSPQRLKP